MHWTITEHARERYKERVSKDGDMLGMLDNTFGAGKRLIKRIRKVCPSHLEETKRKMPYWYRVYREKGEVFVVFVCKITGKGEAAVLTCFIIDS